MQLTRINSWEDLRAEFSRLFTHPLLDLGDDIEYAVSLLCNYNNDWMNFAPGGAPPMLDHVSVLKMVAEVAGINWYYQDMNGGE
jgi:hypothetical protein